MRHLWIYGLIVVSGLFVAQVRAEDVPPQSAATAKVDFSELRPETKTIKVQKVIDPVTFIAEDGTVYKLTGIDVPGAADGSSEIAGLATKELSTLLDGQDIKAYLTKDQTKGRQNRMGQNLIQAERRKDGVWIQGKMLSDGLARVRTTPSNTELLKSMLALETAARTEKKGLWADQRYAVLTPGTVQAGRNEFAIVEGRVFSIATRNNETFLNFAIDWKKDFTIGLSSEMRREMAKAGINYANLAHKNVRVRGFIEDRNGPFISLDHPGQLEILDATLPAIAAPATGSFKTPEAPKAPDIETPEITEPAAPTPPKRAMNE